MYIYIYINLVTTIYRSKLFSGFYFLSYIYIYDRKEKNIAIRVHLSFFFLSLFVNTLNSIYIYGKKKRVLRLNDTCSSFFPFSLAIRKHVRQTSGKSGNGEQLGFDGNLTWSFAKHGDTSTLANRVNKDRV